MTAIETKSEKQPPKVKKLELTYRPEIDGLRAVAVLGVVLFHADLGFTGGYVGVDVFFVISGFLITSLILKDLERDQFSFRDFWARRVRRILPASTAIVIAVAVSAFMLLVSSDIQRVMRSVLWNQLFVANYYFYSQVGYFAESAELQPLLHTWSLAVEEQFYIFFPIFLVVGRRYASNYLLWLTVTVAAASLLISITLLQTDGAAAFFLLPSRAWELLTGAIVALLPDLRIQRRTAECMTVVGLALVLLPMFLYTKQTPFPGLAAIAPVLGTAAIIIAASAERRTILGRVLSYNSLVSIGKLSYSLYLWHWPLFAFSSLLLTGLPLTLRLSLVGISLLLAIPSYYLIEQPFRQSAHLRTPRLAYTFAGCTAAPILVLAAFALKFDGFPSLMDERSRLLSEDMRNTSTKYKTSDGSPVAIGASRAMNDGPEFVVWGDSHAMACACVFDDVAHDLGLSGDVYATSALAPVPGVGHRVPGDPRLEPLSATAYNEGVKEAIVESRPDLVVLVSRWSVYTSGFNDIDSAQGKKRFASLAAESIGVSPDTSIATNLLRDKLSSLLSELTNSGIKVWVMAQVPEAASRAPARDLLILHRFGRLNRLLGTQPIAMTYAKHRARQREASHAINAASDFDDVVLIDLAPQFFDASGVLQLWADRSYYRDGNHLTEFGAERFVAPAALRILGSIAGNRKQ